MYQKYGNDMQCAIGREIEMNTVAVNELYGMPTQ